ncbi:uncharacterized protein DUF4198 [Novosphingobium sp. PhB165]|uniref:DUF4198 domain-containing protein n=1 Tax=Novosphingobium sp. PhB165 TaxID=2485105 RepID=UPI0010522FA8|nr:DUF4198 domain-containing protein [Novosphingobium sp. PhB165]TCM21655.1 uncharacterized protein DUF4198 [Novosphingobium sp. PhB165]
MKAYATGLLAAAALLALPTAASAHRQWLLPSVTTLAGTDGWVTVDAAVSNDLFDPDHFPMQTDQIQVTQPDGSKGRIQNAATGRYRSMFDVQVDKAGTWKIGTFSSNLGGTFSLNGETWRVGARRGPPPGAAGMGPGGPGAARPEGARPEGAPRPAGGEGGPRPGGEGGFAPAKSVASVAEIPAGATDIKLTESISRNEFFVTAGEPTKTVLAPTGKGLEFDPVTHPDDLVSNEPARFRFLIDGKPAAGLTVTVIPGSKRFRDGEHALSLTTGADGTVEVKWPFAGVYWLNVTATDNHASDSRAAERRMSYTTTLEVPAP